MKNDDKKNTFEVISRNATWNRFYKKLTPTIGYYDETDNATLEDIAALIDKYDLTAYLHDETLPAMLARLVTFDDSKHDGSIILKQNTKYRAAYYMNKTSIDLALRMYSYLKHNNIIDMAPAITLTYVSYTGYRYGMSMKTDFEQYHDVFKAIMNHDYTDDYYSLTDMFPSFDMMKISDTPNAVPCMNTSPICIMQPYYAIATNKNIDVRTLFKTGYRNMMEIIFIEAQFPFRAYNLMKKSYYSIIANLDSNEIEWFIECMKEIIRVKPVINGGVTLEWIKKNINYPVEFVIQNENISNCGGSAVYKDIAEEALNYAVSNNYLLKAGYAAMLGLQIDKYQYSQKPSPAMINENRKVAERILNLDARVFTSYPTAKDNTNQSNHAYDSYWLLPYTGFDLFTSTMGGTGYMLRNACTPRNQVKIAEQALKTNETAYRWAVINCMFKYLEKAAEKYMNLIYNDFIKTVNAGHTVSNVSISKELKRYMRGEEMPASFAQKTQSGSITITLPEPLLMTMNQMPVHIDELPSDKTGYELFCVLLKQNTEKYSNMNNGSNEDRKRQFNAFYDLFVNED